jgi:hypothetical protein
MLGVNRRWVTKMRRTVYKRLGRQPCINSGTVFGIIGHTQGRRLHFSNRYAGWVRKSKAI